MLKSECGLSELNNASNGNTASISSGSNSNGGGHGHATTTFEVFVEKRIKQLEKDRLELPNLHSQRYRLQAKLGEMTQRHQFHDRRSIEQELNRIGKRIATLEDPSYVEHFRHSALPYLLAADQERLSSSMQQYLTTHQCKNPTAPSHVISVKMESTSSNATCNALDTESNAIHTGVAQFTFSADDIPTLKNSGCTQESDITPFLTISTQADPVELVCQDFVKIQIVPDPQYVSSMRSLELAAVHQLPSTLQSQKRIKKEVYAAALAVTTATAATSATTVTLADRENVPLPASKCASDTPVKKKRGRKRLVDKQAFVNADPKRVRCSLDKFIAASSARTPSTIKQETMTVVAIQQDAGLCNTQETDMELVAQDEAHKRLCQVKMDALPLVRVNIEPVHVGVPATATAAVGSGSEDHRQVASTAAAAAVAGAAAATAAAANSAVITKSPHSGKKKTKVDSLVFQHFLMDVEHMPKTVEMVDDDVCIQAGCNKRPLVRITDASLLKCAQCGYSKNFFDAISTSGSIGNPTQVQKYSEGGRFAEWLILFENLESFMVPDVKMQSIMEDLYVHGIKQTRDLTILMVRESMKRLHFDDLYKHTTQVYCRLTGRAPPRRTEAQREITQKMADAIHKEWDTKYRPANRKNAMSYPYKYYKICQSNNWTHFFEFFVLFSGADKLQKHENWMRNIYRDIYQQTGDARYIFIPVPSNPAMYAPRHDVMSSSVVHLPPSSTEATTTTITAFARGAKKRAYEATDTNSESPKKTKVSSV
jgi:hypothetical protein